MREEPSGISMQLRDAVLGRAEYFVSFEDGSQAVLREGVGWQVRLPDPLSGTLVYHLKASMAAFSRIKTLDIKLGLFGNPDGSGDRVRCHPPGLCCCGWEDGVMVPAIIQLSERETSYVNAR